MIPSTIERMFMLYTVYTTHILSKNARHFSVLFSTQSRTILISSNNFFYQTLYWSCIKVLTFENVFLKIFIKKLAFSIVHLTIEKIKKHYSNNPFKRILQRVLAK